MTTETFRRADHRPVPTSAHEAEASAVALQAPSEASASCCFPLDITHSPSRRRLSKEIVGRGSGAIPPGASLQDIYSTGLHPLDELVELFRRILAIGVQTCHVVAPGGETPLHPLPNRLAVPLIPLKGVHVHLRVFLIEDLRDPRGIICAAVVDHVDGVDDLPRIVGYSGDDAPDGFCGVIGRNEDAKGLSDNY